MFFNVISIVLLVIISMLVIQAVIQVLNTPEHNQLGYSERIHVMENGVTYMEVRHTYMSLRRFRAVKVRAYFLAHGNFKNYSVSVLRNGQEIFFTEASPTSPGVDGTFTVNITDGVADFIINTQVNRNEKITVILRYFLTQGALRFLDTGHMHRVWNPRGADGVVDAFSIHVSFEGYVSQEELRVIASGGEAGFLYEITSDGEVVFEAENVPFGEWAVFNVLFPVRLLPYADIIEKELLGLLDLPANADS